MAPKKTEAQKKEDEKNAKEKAEKEEADRKKKEKEVSIDGLRLITPLPPSPPPPPPPHNESSFNCTFLLSTVRSLFQDEEKRKADEEARMPQREKGKRGMSWASPEHLIVSRY